MPSLSAAAVVGAAPGIADIRAGLHSEDQVAAIKEMTDQGHKIAMIGDGVNDSPGPGVLTHEGSAVAACLNSLRILFAKG